MTDETQHTPPLARLRYVIGPGTRRVGWREMAIGGIGGLTS